MASPTFRTLIMISLSIRAFSLLTLIMITLSIRAFSLLILPSETDSVVTQVTPPKRRFRVKTCADSNVVDAEQVVLYVY